MQSRTLSSWVLWATIAVAALAAFTLALSSRPLPSRASHAQSDDWRRTPAGWERRSAWQGAAHAAVQPTYSFAASYTRKRASDGPQRNRRPHPAAIALCELIAVLAALVVWRPSTGKSIAGKTHCALAG